jgi:hypothetical protein
MIDPITGRGVSIEDLQRRLARCKAQVAASKDPLVAEYFLTLQKHLEQMIGKLTTVVQSN